jgi:cullin 3
MHALFSRSDRAGKHLLHLFRQEVNSVLAEDPNNIPVTIEKLKKFNSVIMRSLSRDYASELQSVAECVLLSSVSKSLAEWLHKRIRTASSEIEKSLEDFLVLFRFLSSKDVFEAYYRYFLARRLLSQSGSDSQIELLVVSQLREECGNAYSSKIEAMLNDMQSSAQLTREWKQSNQNDELLHPILLTGSLWSGMKHLAVNLPLGISESVATFERFYLAKFQGRKLTWIHSHGSAELKFFTNSEFFILSCTVLQAIILDLFNHSDRLSLDFICKSLNTSIEEIRRHLLSLHVNTKCQILINDSPAASTDAESILQVNLAFQAKSKHVKVPLIVDDSVSSNDLLDMPNREETLDTASGLEQVVMEDRKHLIEAAIVRIMKTKRQLDQNGIVVELAKIFENRFTPSINMIKDRVENLVDREFIARDNENVKLFYYVA